MATKNLGQVSAIVISSSQPSNSYVLWFDLSSNSLKYFNFATSAWDSLSGASNIGQIKLNSSDSIGYLVDKLDSTLRVSGGQLGVVVPVSTAEKAKWNGNTTTYFVTTHAGLASLSPSTGDRAIVADDGAGIRAGYYWSGAAWLKDFDPQWENINLHWSNIVDVPDGTTSTKGVLQLATDSEVSAGTVSTKPMTPSQKSLIVASAAAAILPSANSYADSVASSAQSAAISAASADATTKANAAKTYALDTVAGGLITKSFNIGTLNMRTTAITFSAASLGLSDITKIRTWKILINSDPDAGAVFVRSLESDGAIYLVPSSNSLDTTIGTSFDTIDFDGTSINRGILTISYLP